MITVSDFQKVLEQEQIKLIAGDEGLDKVIEYLDVQEFPFKSTRVHKNSVILTTFYGFKSIAEIIEHFEWYIKVGVSGICVHNVVYSEVPNELLDLANEAKIPLFYIPANIPYHLLYEKYLELIYEERSKIKGEIDQLNQNMLDALVIEKENHYIIQSLGKYLDEYIIYLNKEMKVVSLWNSPHFSRLFLRHCIDEVTNDFQQIFNQVRLTLKPIEVPNQHSQLGDFQVFPLNSKMDFYGYLIIGQLNKEAPFRHVVIKNALTALILDAMKKNQTKEYHKNKDIILLEEIFSDKRITEITSEDFYFDINNIKYLLMAELEDKSKLREYYSFIESKVDKEPNGLVWIMDNRIMALVQNQFNTNALGKDIKVGLSGKLKGLTRIDLKTIYEQATIALHYSSIHDQAFCSWDELGYEKVMYFMRMTNLLEDYHLDFLQPLIIHDKSNDTNLMKTLYVYLQTFFSLKESGEQLHLHPNTVKYRIKKIEDLLDNKIDDSNRYIDLMLGLKYYFYKTEVESKG
ncbi:PucR family transcriptional regulator [Bacillus sp. JJ1532]|uniref:PucR family transcriptional regulator n=1 Tax=Bacillus sp. JJ1532 TaxID=3122958 RepID=UPI002FFE8CE6